MDNKELRYPPAIAGRGPMNGGLPRWPAQARGGLAGRRWPRMERRDHTRHAAHVIVEIRGRLQGSPITELRGVTMDVSRGGALVLFMGPVAADPDRGFMVRFVDADGNVIAPEFRRGTFLRSKSLRFGGVVAVRFREPLPRTVLRTLLSEDLAPTKWAQA